MCVFGEQVLFYHSLPYSHEAVSLTEVGARLAAKPSDPPASAPTAWGYRNA